MYTNIWKIIDALQKEELTSTKKEKTILKEREDTN